MKEQRPKKINQTFSIPLEISQELHTYVKRREMSGFVAEAIRKELELKKEELRKAYRSANKDPGQLDAKDWEPTLSDGTEEW
jgi:hypothetical protein